MILLSFSYLIQCFQDAPCLVFGADGVLRPPDLGPRLLGDDRCASRVDQPGVRVLRGDGGLVRQGSPGEGDRVPQRSRAGDEGGSGIGQDGGEDDDLEEPHPMVGLRETD